MELFHYNKTGATPVPYSCPEERERWDRSRQGDPISMLGIHCWEKPTVCDFGKHQIEIEVEGKIFEIGEECNFGNLFETEKEHIYDYWWCNDKTTKAKYVQRLVESLKSNGYVAIRYINTKDLPTNTVSFIII